MIIRYGTSIVVMTISLTKKYGKRVRVIGKKPDPTHQSSVRGKEPMVLEESFDVSILCKS